jgi:murein L,D-transpeptidase YcbB/YkuD
VKFLFPNEHNVYLHDTPARGLFEESERAFSHGCIRLGRPLDLAEEVLGPQGWDRARIDQVVASGKNTPVQLATPLPVHITYLTAWTESGRVNFRSDIYKHDEKLVAALAGRTMAW